MESGAELGGKLRTGSLSGAPIELGADSFVDRDGSVAALCAELGLPELESPRVFGANLWQGDRVVALPASTFMGIPLNLRDARNSGCLTARGAARAAVDRLWPLPHKGPDVSIGRMLRLRFGSEVVDRMVDPVLAGTRAGLVDEISAAAALPELDAAARDGRSVTAGLLALRGARPVTASSFARPRGGMSRLVDGLHDAIGPAQVRLGTSAVRVETRGDRYRVILQAGDALDADAVIVTVPAWAAADLLRSLDSRMADELGRIEYSSPAVLSLAFNESAAPRIPSGRSGLLAPRAVGSAFDACTFYSSKWGHDPGEPVLFRIFAGRTSSDEIVDEARWVRRVQSDLRRAFPGTGDPVATAVVRWRRGLPIYRVGHGDRVDRIFTRAGRHPGLELAGAAYRGSGIAACLEGGRAAAARTLAYLHKRGPGG